MPSEPLPDHRTGPRLTIRRWQPHEVDLLATSVAESAEHLRPWMPWIAEEPLAREDRVALIETWQRDWVAGGDLVIGLFLGDETVGNGGLHHRIGPGALEIGYWVHVDHVGKGYATEATGLLTDLAFTVPALERVEVHHDLLNEASGAVPRRLGFERLTDVPARVPAPEGCGVEARWVMTREAWVARPEAPGR